MISDLFNYDRNVDLELREVRAQPGDGFVQRTITYRTAAGIHRAAGLIQPDGKGPFAAVLFVHWYEPEAPTSNRSQFEAEAIELAKQGVVSLLVETMWSDPDWFIKRTQAEDWDASIQQVIELRQAMDLLLAQPGVEPERLAYVGHDFGAMYGVLAGAVDPRPVCYVLMAGTPCFADWYLYYPRLEGEARDEFVQQMRAIDPIRLIGDLAPAPVFFQFGTRDPHVPIERAEEFFATAGEPKRAQFYEAGHGLNDRARADRLQWLREQLGLPAGIGIQ